MKIKELINDVPVLETERLVLRKFNNNDADDLYEYCKDPEVTKYLIFETYENIETAQDRIDFLQAKYAQEKMLCWAIVEKYSKKVIGSIDLCNICDKDKKAEAGYVLNREYWNRGYMTECLKRVLDYAFNELGLVRVYAKCIISNIASETVMKKTGMSFEGVEKKSVYIKGKYYDVKQYAITDEEYIQIK